MAGKPGRSGGARPGSGPRKKEPVKLDVKPIITKVDVSVSECLKHKDPKGFLLALMNDYEADIKLRAEAAKALLPFMHGKLGENTIKADKAEAAKKAATGKFGSAAPPLRVVNGG
jgi:phage terminase small subunit